jgi:hypothetical protein
LDAETIAAMTVATTAARNPEVVVADVSVAAAVAVVVVARVALREAAAICRPRNTLRRRVLPRESSAAMNRAGKARIAARNLAALSLVVSKIAAPKLLAMAVLIPPRPVSMPPKSLFFSLVSP